MSRVQAIEFHDSGIIYVILTKTVQGHVIGEHRLPLEPDADAEKIKQIIDTDFRKQALDEIDDTWQRIMPAIVKALHTPELVRSYAERKTARLASLNPSAPAPAPAPGKRGSHR